MNYPYDRIDGATGNIIERFQEPPMFDVKYVFSKTKRIPSFRIIANRTENPEGESYEIEISGAKRIKKVMR